MTAHKKTMPSLGKYEKRLLKLARLLDNFHKSIFVVAGAKWENIQHVKRMFHTRLQKN